MCSRFSLLLFEDIILDRIEISHIYFHALFYDSHPLFGRDMFINSAVDGLQKNCVIVCQSGIVCFLGNTRS